MQMQHVLAATAPDFLFNIYKHPPMLPWRFRVLLVFAVSQVIVRNWGFPSNSCLASNHFSTNQYTSLSCNQMNPDVFQNPPASHNNKDTPKNSNRWLKGDLFDLYSWRSLRLNPLKRHVFTHHPEKIIKRRIARYLKLFVQPKLTKN